MVHPPAFSSRHSLHFSCHSPQTLAHTAPHAPIHCCCTHSSWGRTHHLDGSTRFSCSCSQHSRTNLRRRQRQQPPTALLHYPQPIRSGQLSRYPITHGFRQPHLRRRAESRHLHEQHPASQRLPFLPSRLRHARWLHPQCRTRPLRNRRHLCGLPLAHSRYNLDVPHPALAFPPIAQRYHPTPPAHGRRQRLGHPFHPAKILCRPYGTNLCPLQRSHLPAANPCQRLHHKTLRQRLLSRPLSRTSTQWLAFLHLRMVR